MDETVKIGSLRLTEPQEFKCESGYARWYNLIRVQPCEVPVYGILQDDGTLKDWPGPRWELSGPVIASDWSPCYGGVPFADGIDKNLGEIATYYGNTYSHALASAIVEGRAQPITLLPDFEAVRVEYQWKGETRHTYTIRRRPDPATLVIESLVIESLAKETVALRNALQALTRDPAIRGWLESHDPQALKQALRALGEDR